MLKSWQMRSLITALRTTFSKRRYQYLAFAAIIIAIIAISGLFFFVTQVPRVEAQSAVGRLPEVPAPASGQKILVFSPHPDDETIAVGGYIAQGIRNGADVRIVLVTDGDKDHQKAIRYAEFEKATGILGVPQGNLIFLNFPDGKLSSENQALLSASLQAQIDQYHPDIIIYPNPRDYNPDHATIGRLMESILKTESLHVTAYEYLIHYELIYPRPRKFDPHLYLSPPKRLAVFDKVWLCFPLSQDIENCKEKAIFTYQSQLHSPELNGLLHSFIRKNELLTIPRI